MKFLPESIETSLKEHFSASGKPLNIQKFSFSSGGCINSAGLIETDTGRMFIKWNNRKSYPKMFETELDGLKLLGSSKVIRVPKPIFVGHTESFSFLIMEYISSAHKSRMYWDLLGKGLASLHRQSADKFGLDYNNYIGSLMQINNQEDDWITFFVNHRLEFQLQLAVDHGKMGRKYVQKFQKLYKILADLLQDKASPSLLHGDLWSGNLMTGSLGEPVIIDPAVYFGHREIDLAMTRLFGGFDSEFYDSYNESFPLDPGLEDRMDIYQLYPLLVHVNLFGGGYISQVEAILNRFV